MIKLPKFHGTKVTTLQELGRLVVTVSMFLVHDPNGLHMFLGRWQRRMTKISRAPDRWSKGGYFLHFYNQPPKQGCFKLEIVLNVSLGS